MQDEPMPTEPPRSPTRAWLAGCVVHQEPPREAPQAQVYINGRPYPALLDSGSAVSLAQSSIFPPRVGVKARLPITCIHGDTRNVPTRWITVTASPGTWPLEVGVVKDLPVPVLLGRDWRGFWNCSPKSHSLPENAENELPLFKRSAAATAAHNENNKGTRPFPCGTP